MNTYSKISHVRDKRSDLEALVDVFLLPELRKDPPHALHEVDVHGLVVILEVNPPPRARDDGLPLGDVLGDDAAARLVVLGDADVEHLLPVGDAERLVDLELDGEAVAVPPEPARDVPPPHRLVAGDHVLDGAGEYVAVVGQARGEGGPVVEYELLAALRAAELLMEGVDLLPQLEHPQLLLREGEVLPLTHVVHGLLSGGCSSAEGGWDSGRGGGEGRECGEGFGRGGGGGGGRGKGVWGGICSGGDGNGARSPIPGDFIY